MKIALELNVDDKIAKYERLKEALAQDDGIGTELDLKGSSYINWYDMVCSVIPLLPKTLNGLLLVGAGLAGYRVMIAGEEWTVKDAALALKAQCPDLKTLSLSFRIKHIDEILAECLPSHLVSLSIIRGGNELMASPPEDFVKINDFFRTLSKCCPNLQHIDFSENQMRLNFLADYLPVTLKSLDLSFNHLMSTNKDIFITFLKTLLERNSNIELILTQSQSVGDEAIVYLEEIKQSVPNIVLNCEGSSIKLTFSRGLDLEPVHQERLMLRA